MATEEETKHTPGPWHHDGYERVRPVDGKQDGSNDICHVYHRLDGRSNLRLIAAAPDLLEACQLLMVHAENGGGDMYDQAVLLAREAIFKATQ